MVTLLLFAGILGFLLYIAFRSESKFKVLADKLPGPPPKLFIGNAFDIPLTGPKCQSVHMEMFNTYGSGFRVWAGPLLLYICANSLDIEVLLKSATEVNKNFIYKYLRNILGEGLLLSSGEKWHLRRKAITPSFHSQILEEFVGVFEKHSETLVSRLEERVGKGEFELNPYTGAYTLDVITETSMKKSVNAQLDPDNVFSKSIKEILQGLVNRTNSPWLYSDTLYKLFGHLKKEQKLASVLHEHYYKSLEEAKKSESMDLASSKPDELGRTKKMGFLPSLLKLKLENNPIFQTDEDIREEVFTLIFGGHDPLTTAINFALGCMARHPEIQEKAFEEVKDVLGSIDRLSLNNLNQLKYLERVIKETLRLYPSAPIIGRQLVDDMAFPSSGHIVPAGTIVGVHLFILHRNPLYFPNPHVFDPDNFLPENIEKRPVFSYLPFSSGPRSCVGQRFAMFEMKSVLARLLLNYKFSCEPGTSKDIPVTFELTLQAANGHKIKVAKR